MGVKKNDTTAAEETVTETPAQPPLPDDTAPNPWAVMNRVAAAMEALAARQTQAPNDHVEQLIAVLGTTMSRLSEAQITGAEIVAQETKRAHRPSNEVVPQVSVFNRRGTDEKIRGDAGPHKQPLKCIMLIPWLVEWESCTREEVDLLNLLQPGDYILKRIDNTKVRVTVKIEYKTDDITPSRLLMNHDTAFNNDNKNLLPAFSDMLRQLLKQHDSTIAKVAAAIMTDEEEEAMIEAGELSISV